MRTTPRRTWSKYFSPNGQRMLTSMFFLHKKLVRRPAPGRSGRRRVRTGGTGWAACSFAESGPHHGWRGDDALDRPSDCPSAINQSSGCPDDAAVDAERARGRREDAQARFPSPTASLSRSEFTTRTSNGICIRPRPTGEGGARRRHFSTPQKWKACFFVTVSSKPSSLAASSSSSPPSS